MSEQMTSNRPYLIRAVYDWILDNGLTPYLLVDTNHDHVEAPGEYINEDKSIILNISSEACRGLHIGNDRIVFSASFGGNALQICVPPWAVMAIYAQENGRGMVFSEEDPDKTDTANDAGAREKPATKQSKKKKPTLTVVK